MGYIKTGRRNDMSIRDNVNKQNKATKAHSYISIHSIDSEVIHGQIDTLLAVTMQYHIYSTFPKKQIGNVNTIILCVQNPIVTFLWVVISSHPLVSINETYKYSQLLANIVYLLWTWLITRENNMHSHYTIEFAFIIMLIYKTFRYVIDALREWTIEF